MQINYVLRPDWRYQKAEGRFPIRLWISYMDQRDDYQTTLEVSKDDYKKLSISKNLSVELKQLRDDLRKIQTGIDNYLADVTDFEFDTFQTDFINYNSLFIQRKKRVAYKRKKEASFDYSIYEKRFPILSEDHPRQDSISVIFQYIVKTKLRHKKIGTATHYQTSYNTFKRFKGNISFRQVTTAYLEDFKYYFLEKKASLNTIGMYAKNMRTAFNEAIEQGLIKRDRYPFGRRRFVIPASFKKKPVVSQNYMPLIINYLTEDIRKMRARDFWMFLYQANGMNVKDLCYLRYKDIKSYYFSFIRAKVESTSYSQAKEVCVFITEDMWQTIQKYGNRIESPDTFVFPFLTDDLNPLQADDRVETIIYQINRWMKVVFDELGIEGRSSTMLTRYSISNHLKQLGASTEIIKDMLGQSSVRTTEIYLNGFEAEVHGDYVKQLMHKYTGLDEDKNIIDKGW